MKHQEGSIMFKELKKMSLKRVGIQLIESILIIAVILFIFGADMITFMNGPKKLDSLPLTELEDAYVTADIYAILDVFAEYYTEDSNGGTTTTKSYYIIPVGDYEYMALEVPKNEDYTPELEEIYDETYEYLMGNQEYLENTSTIRGSINPLEGEVYDYYIEWFHESGFIENVTTEEINEIALPYLLQIDYAGESEISLLKVMIAIILIILAYDLIILLFALSGISILPIKRYLKKHEDKINLERFEADFLQADSIGKITFFKNTIRIGNGYTFYLSNCFAKVIANEDIVWVYMENYTRKLYGLKLFSLQSIHLYTYTKKQYQIYINDQNTIHKAIDVLVSKQPHMVAGYSDERKKLFKKDFDSFMKLTFDNTDMYEEDYTPPKDNNDIYHDVAEEGIAATLSPEDSMSDSKKNDL